MTGTIRFPLIISVLAVFIGLNLFPASALEGPEDRQLHLEAISGLDREAERLTQELLVLDLQLKKSRQEKGAAEKELAATRVRKEQSAGEYQKSLEFKNQRLKKVSLWINFQYRYGYWSLLDVILGSETFSDLIHRTVVVAIILGRQADDYRKAAEACTASLQREKALAEEENLLARQSRLLDDQISLVQNLSDRRREFLEEISMQSHELSLRVAVLERKFLESMNLVDILTGALASFPWQEVKPDRVSVSPGGILVELSESNLNRSLQASGIKDLEGLSISLKPGLMVINGRDRKSSSSFSLGGVLVPSGQSEAVTLEPKTFSLDGIPVTREVIGELAGGPGINLRVPGDTGFRPSRIEIGDQKLGIILAF